MKSPFSNYPQLSFGGAVRAGARRRRSRAGSINIYLKKKCLPRGGWTEQKALENKDVAAMYLWVKAKLMDPSLSDKEQKEGQKYLADLRKTINQYPKIYQRYKYLKSGQKDFPCFMKLSPDERYSRFRAFDDPAHNIVPENAWGAFPAAYPAGTTKRFPGMAMPAREKTVIEKRKQEITEENKIERGKKLAYYNQLVTKIYKEMLGVIRFVPPKGIFNTVFAGQLREMGYEKLAERVPFLETQHEKAMLIAVKAAAIVAQTGKLIVEEEAETIFNQVENRLKNLSVSAMEDEADADEAEEEESAASASAAKRKHGGAVRRRRARKMRFFSL